MDGEVYDEFFITTDLYSSPSVNLSAYTLLISEGSDGVYEKYEIVRSISDSGYILS